MTREDLIDLVAQRSTEVVDMKELMRLYYDDSYSMFEYEFDNDLDSTIEIAKDLGVLDVNFNKKELDI